MSNSNCNMLFHPSKSHFFKDSPMLPWCQKIRLTIQRVEYFFFGDIFYFIYFLLYGSIAMGCWNNSYTKFNEIIFSPFNINHFKWWKIVCVAGSNCVCVSVCEIWKVKFLPKLLCCLTLHPFPCALNLYLIKFVLFLLQAMKLHSIQW